VIDPAGDLTHDGVIPVKRPRREAEAAGRAEQLHPHRPIRADRRRLGRDRPVDSPGSGGELQLTDALRAQAARSPFHAVVAEESRLDTGTPLGFLTASIELGLADPELAAPLRDFLAHLHQ
jgi:UTP--glucose-1-phosphate uridylyltransferase